MKLHPPYFRNFRNSFSSVRRRLRGRERGLQLPDRRRRGVPPPAELRLHDHDAELGPDPPRHVHEVSPRGFVHLPVRLSSGLYRSRSIEVVICIFFGSCVKHRRSSIRAFIHFSFLQREKKKKIIKILNKAINSN